MNKSLLLLAFWIGSTILRAEDAGNSHPKIQTLSEAVKWLEVTSKKMIQDSRREMSNGVAAFPPQAGAGYEAFWLRDYAYMLEGCPTAFTKKELLESCQLFVNAARNDGAGVDCVKFNGEPIYKPGYGSMGDNPVADGSMFTVDVVWNTYLRTRDTNFLKRVIDVAVKTLRAAPRDPTNGLIYIKPGGWDRCPYGFTDSVHKQGDELFCSLLYVQSCRQLAEMLYDVGKTDDEVKKWLGEAGRLEKSIRATFWDEDIGLFRAATVSCGQPDIWGSAFAVWLDVATPQQAKTIANYFKDHYSEIVQRGQIRHLPGNTYWDSACAKDTYQNGGYWATGTGWFVYALNDVDPDLAAQTIIDLVNDFQERGVTEWVLGDHTAVKNYIASATMPLAGARRMLDHRKPPIDIVLP